MAQDWLNALFEEQKCMLHRQVDLQCALLHRQVDETCTAAFMEKMMPEQPAQMQMEADTQGGLYEKASEEGEASMEPKDRLDVDAVVHPDKSIESGNNNSVGTPSQRSTPSDRIRAKVAHRKQQTFHGLMASHSMDSIHMTRKFGAPCKVISKLLDPLMGFLIIGNVFVQFVQMQFLGQKADSSLGLEVSTWPHAELVFTILDFFFSTVFVAELILRVCAQGRDYFSSGFNILDAAVVPLTAIDTFILAPTQVAEKANINVSFMRVLQFFRIMRTLRIIRTLGRFRQLRVLWNTISASFLSLTYSMITMFIFMTMLALFLTQALHFFIVDESQNLESREWLNRAYGNAVKSTWTVFELTFSGCWPNYVTPVIEDVGWVYGIVFALYVSAVVFAMTRIVAAMFLKETLQQASEDTELIVKERARDVRGLEESLFGLFKASDADNDGLLTEDEVCRVLDNDRIKHWLGRLGIDASDPAALFRLLDSNCENVIAWDAFVYGIKRLKGEARAQDLVPLVNDCKRILRHCEQITAKLESRHTAIVYR